MPPEIERHVISCNLKIDLEPDPLGVGGIFLYGWIRNETAVRQGVNGFCSIPVFHGEKNDLKFWGHRAQKLRLRLYVCVWS